MMTVFVCFSQLWAVETKYNLSSLLALTATQSRLREEIDSYLINLCGLSAWALVTDVLEDCGMAQSGVLCWGWHAL